MDAPQRAFVTAMLPAWVRMSVSAYIPLQSRAAERFLECRIVSDLLHGQPIGVEHAKPTQGLVILPLSLVALPGGSGLCGARVLNLPG